MESFVSRSLLHILHTRMAITLLTHNTTSLTPNLFRISSNFDSQIGPCSSPGNIGTIAWVTSWNNTNKNLSSRTDSGLCSRYSQFKSILWLQGLVTPRISSWGRRLQRNFQPGHNSLKTSFANMVYIAFVFYQRYAIMVTIHFLICIRYRFYL